MGHVDRDLFLFRVTDPPGGGERFPSLNPPSGVVSVINSAFPPLTKIFCQSISDGELGSRDFPDHPVPKTELPVQSAQVGSLTREVDPTCLD